MDTHKWTDAQLKRLERQIKTEYTKAYKEIKQEMAEIMAKISLDDNMTLAQKMAALSKYDRLDNLCNQMAGVLQDTNAAALSFVEKSATNIFKTVYNTSAEQLGFSLLDNTAVKNILTGQVNPFTKLSIAADTDKSVIMRKLKSELTTAILKGESIPNMAKRLKSVSEGYLSNTVRIARTETTRVENSAHQSVAEEGTRLGFKMKKRWVATSDDRTRQAHLDADGQEVAEDEPFEVDGEELMYPGDISLGASAANICNCRCRIVAFIDTGDKKQ